VAVLDCREVAELETTIRVAGRLAPGVIPDATMGSLVAAFRSWPRGTPPA
jgi:hypothetical protein